MKRCDPFFSVRQLGAVCKDLPLKKKNIQAKVSGRHVGGLGGGKLKQQIQPQIQNQFS